MQFPDLPKDADLLALGPSLVFLLGVILHVHDYLTMPLYILLENPLYNNEH